MNALGQTLTELVHYRDLLFSLTLRDLRIRYKQSLLGIAWALFTPLAMMLLFTLFTQAKVLNIDTGDVPYVIFVYCGILPWTFFSSSLAGATTCLVANHSLVTKIYFPREVFPFSMILSKLLDLLIASSLLVCLMLFYKIPFQQTLIALPALLLLQIIFMLGMALLLSMGNLYFRDVKYLFDVLIVLWMFATSVIYPIQLSNPILQKIFMLNPMTPIIDSYRAVIIHGQWPNMANLAPAIVISLAVFLIGVIWFQNKQYEFAERI